MSKKNDPKSQGRTGGLPPFQQKTNPKGSPTDSPIILISETKETKESKNENKNESEENQEEKTPEYTSTSQSNDNILPPGHASDDGREDDQASDVEDDQNVEFNSSQRLLVSIMKSMRTRSYNLDPAVEMILQEDKMSEKKYKELIENYPWPEEYEPHVTFANDVAKLNITTAQRARVEETGIQECRLLELLGVTLFSATALLSETNKNLAIRGIYDCIRILLYDLEQIRHVRQKLCTEALGASIPKKEIRGISAIPILGDDDIKRISKQATISRSLSLNRGKKGRTLSLRNNNRRGRNRQFFRNGRNGNRGSTTSSDSSSGSNSESSVAKRGGRHQ